MSSSLRKTSTGRANHRDEYPPFLTLDDCPIASCVATRKLSEPRDLEPKGPFMRGRPSSKSPRAPCLSSTRRHEVLDSSSLPADRPKTFAVKTTLTCRVTPMTSRDGCHLPKSRGAFHRKLPPVSEDRSLLPYDLVSRHAAPLGHCYRENRRLLTAPPRAASP